MSVGKTMRGMREGWRGWVTDLEEKDGFTMAVGFESGGRLSVEAKYKGEEGTSMIVVFESRGELLVVAEFEEEGGVLGVKKVCD